MGRSLINNLSALSGWRHVNEIKWFLDKSMEKLVSGMKINSAADGPAALVVSEHLRSRIASLNQEIENTTLAISKYDTADSDLLQLRRMVTDMRSLAVAASDSGVNDESMREAYQIDADNSMKNFNDIIKQASFNGRELLDGSDGSLASVPELSRLDLSMAESAAEAVVSLDGAASRLDSIIAEIGSTRKNDLEARLANLRVESQNLMAAESQIRDTDFLMEYSNFIRNEITLRSAMAILGYQDMNARSVLMLFNSDR